MSNSGTDRNAIFDFVIPRGANGLPGEPGSPGAPGSDGEDGITPTVEVTQITGGHNVAFDYGNDDPRNTNFDVLDGQAGAPGRDGNDGQAATVSVGTTTTGAAGSNASVSNSGTSSAAVLNFTIPRGAKGDQGDSMFEEDITPPVYDDNTIATENVQPTYDVYAAFSSTIVFTDPETSSAVLDLNSDRTYKIDFYDGSSMHSYEITCIHTFQ